MKPIFLMAGTAWSLAASPALAGPYAPAPGQPGSTAIHRTDPRFTAWAGRVTDYQVGTDCLPQWQDPKKALGPATDDSTHITCLGAGGRITLAFPCYIKDGPGADFAVFENSFLDDYIEHAWVEVSRDGVNFIRFPNHSLTQNPVGAFDLLDTTNVQGLGSKYRQPYGEPYDLAAVGLDSVSHVRLVDVIGDGSARDSDNRIIYDPFPNSQSAGFDLDAIGVIHQETWQTLAAGTVMPERINASAFAHLPDGRFILGSQGQLSVQTAWGLPGRTTIGTGGVEFDPAFLAVRDGTSAILGAGGGFGGSTGVHGFNPAVPAQALTPAPLASLQNYSAAWRASEIPGHTGWLIGGTNGPLGRHNITFVSSDGSVKGPVTAELSTFSSGFAVDASGNVFTALYELSGPEAETVLRFPSTQIDSAIAAILSGTPAPVAKASGTALFKFDSASSLAVDGLGRIWGSGFKANHLQVYDPATGASRRIVPDHAPLAGVTDTIYDVQTFTRNGEPYVAFLAKDEAGTTGTPLLHGLAPLSHLTVPESVASWRVFQFGGENLNPATEPTLWGNDADPDGDGMANLLEYALTTNPLTPESPPLAAGQLSGRLALTFPRNPLRPDLRYTVEVSTSLAAAGWSALATGEGGDELIPVPPAAPKLTETAAGKLVSVEVRDALTMTSQSRRFLRLRVTLIP